MPLRMPSGVPARRRPRLRVLPALLLAAGLSTGLAAPAAAAPQGAVPLRAAAPTPIDAGALLSVAGQFTGTPYRYGGTTPRGFDCSGYTGFVFRHFGVHLPRTATEQMRATRRVSDPRPGDLVFFPRGGRAYHTGIYAGDGYMYDSPRAGKSVSKRKIWTSAVVFHRVA